MASLWELVSPEQLEAEDLVLMPRSLLRDGQVEALEDWLRAEGARQTAEADALEAELRRRQRERTGEKPDLGSVVSFAPQAVRSIRCSKCGELVHSDEILIAWDHDFVDGVDTVTRLAVVHRNTRGKGSGCDDGELPCSAGACYGRNWNPDEDGIQWPVFANAADQKLYQQLIAQRRIDWRPGEPPFDPAAA